MKKGCLRSWVELFRLNRKPKKAQGIQPVPWSRFFVRARAAKNWAAPAGLEKEFLEKKLARGSASSNVSAWA